MLRTILIYGLVAGVLVGVPMNAMMAAMDGHPPTSWGMAFGYTTMLIALSTVFIAIKRRRDIELGGVIRFWPALGLGLGISVVAGITYVLAWELAQNMGGMDFASDYARILIDQERAKGVSAAELARFAEGMEQFKRDYANPLYRLPMTFAEIFPVGLLVSLISAGLLRNPRFMPARRTVAASS